eukprot:CAMPEP_0174285280 /NCGR_PEP_ID=MMETSP0809-20121228/8140_1 /TAXON_ID=73025 ORGANISM="Eutreptiella gymnastica-like, Strain CCMP1594" /NCGR_SAMPLE_ID=MMETSP0809 /ASSEMBLY_ACC=CAM_ASM_000658 /LENGTH=144 /DNA_ID=CAMNT_0015381001 /DNA_START=69 /DNA_END=503 /DNA_ORIENTATION=-
MTSTTHETFRYILSPFGLGCAECDYLKEEIYPVLVPLLEKLLRIVVEINTQAANDATCMGIDDKEGPKRACIGTLPTDLWNGNFNPYLWLAMELKRQSRKKIKARLRKGTKTEMVQKSNRRQRSRSLAVQGGIPPPTRSNSVPS